MSKQPIILITVPINSNNLIIYKCLTAWIIIRNTVLETLLIADIPPTGPKFRLKVIKTFAIPRKIPPPKPIPKLDRTNPPFTFQKIKQKIRKIAPTIANLKKDCSNGSIFFTVTRYFYSIISIELDIAVATLTSTGI